MKSKRIKTMCISALLAATVFVLTAYLHIPIGAGYAHAGDGIIFIAACMLPLPYGIFVGAAGAVLSDLLTGYALWAPCSLVIKAVTVLFFSSKTKSLLCKRNLIALLPSALLCIGGYFTYEMLIGGTVASAVSGITGNVMQSAVSSVLFVVLAFTADKLKLRTYLN